MNQSAQRYETNEPISSEIWNVGKWDTLHSLLAIRPHILPYLPPKKGGQVTGEEYRTDKEAAEGGGGGKRGGIRIVLCYPKDRCDRRRPRLLAAP